jgi:hypothetical protein
MQNALQRSVRIGLFSLLIAVAFETSAGFAQSGSTGGSIGNDEKSLSGSRATPRAVETEKPARRSKPRPEPEEPRRASRWSGGGGGRSGGGGGGGGGGANFDGAWIANSQGNTCQGATQAFVVTSGRIIGEGLSGSISPNGAASSVGNYGSITAISSGRFSGRRGSGTFKRSDGCSGTWTASKQ